MRSSLLMLDLKIDKLYDPENEDEGKTFHILQVLGTNEDFWDILRGLGSIRAQNKISYPLFTF